MGGTWKGQSAIVVVKMEKNRWLLRDVDILNYLLRHEELILKQFNVPVGTSPTKHILMLSNIITNDVTQQPFQQPMSYSLGTIYTTTRTKCTLCEKDLTIKNYQNAKLYDDVLGSNDIVIFTKTCKNCKVNFYPGFLENYKEKSKVFHSDFRNQGVFFSTNRSAFSIDLLERLI